MIVQLRMELWAMSAARSFERGKTMTRINKVAELSVGTAQPPNTDSRNGNYDPYQALASAIIEQAARDLRKVLKKQQLTQL